MFIYFPCCTLTICTSFQHCMNYMTFEMSLFFGTFVSVMFTVNLCCLFHFCLLSTSLALAMLTCVCRANNAHTQQALTVPLQNQTLVRKRQMLKVKFRHSFGMVKLRATFRDRYGAVAHPHNSHNP
jgi:hypothetical protein